MTHPLVFPRFSFRQKSLPPCCWALCPYACPYINVPLRIALAILEIVWWVELSSSFGYRSLTAFSMLFNEPLFIQEFIFLVSVNLWSFCSVSCYWFLVLLWSIWIWQIISFYCIWYVFGIVLGLYFRESSRCSHEENIFLFHLDGILSRCWLSPFDLWCSLALRILCWFLLGMAYAGMGVECWHYYNYFMRICLNFIFVVVCFIKLGDPNFGAFVFIIVLIDELFLLWMCSNLLYLF